MARIFTSNQVNNVYVVKSLSKAGTSPYAPEKPTKASSKGATYVGKTADNSIYFMQRGAAGLVRSDMIDVKDIMYINYTPAAKMKREKNAVLIQLNAAAIDTTMIAGQDYMLKLEFQNPIGMSPDHKYWKHAVVHATSGMTTSQFYAAMAKSLVGNFARETEPLIKVYVLTNNGTAAYNNPSYLTEVTSAKQTLNSTYYGIKIVEADQDWVLGLKQEEPVVFNVIDSTIKNGTAEVFWADIWYSTGKKVTGGAAISESIDATNKPDGGSVNNSKIAAELEYFSMGERADRYRGMGYPDVMHTEYLADDNAAYGYDMINIHYAYVGSNEASQKSEKDITLMCLRDSTDNSNAANGLGAIAVELKSIIEEKLLDDRYLTSSKLFSGAANSYTDGHAAAIDKASDGTLSIVDGGAIG